MRGGRREGAGRPVFAGGAGRTVTVTVKLAPAELDAIRAIAQEAGLTVSAWIRGCALEPLGLARDGE